MSLIYFLAHFVLVTLQSYETISNYKINCQLYRKPPCFLPYSAALKLYTGLITFTTDTVS